MQTIFLRPDEPVALERERIAALYASAGDAQAEEIICRAMEEVAMRLALIERAYASAELVALAKGARGVVAIGAQVGMARLGEVAADVALCAERRDMPALGATLARLMRIGDRSLSEVWDTSGP